MAWKRIGNHSYYYESHREGGRVVSSYRGRGRFAMLCARLDQLTRHERKLKRGLVRDERDSAENEQRAITEWFDRVELVATGAMLATGFHKHPGQQWRKRPGENERRDGARKPGDSGAHAPREDDLG
jgi:hypothetical protein